MSGIKDSLKRAQRQDENSLYMLIERDLDRQVVFPGCSYWEREVYLDKGKNRIDFLIHYSPPTTACGEPKIKSMIEKDLLIGIEAKFDFPKEQHFKQTVKYLDTGINSVFLAYPSDRIGEAINELEKNKDRVDYIGLISISPYRCSVVRKARKLERNNMVNKHILNEKEWSLKEFIKINCKDFTTEVESNFHPDLNRILYEQNFDLLDPLNRNLISIFYSLAVETIWWTSLPLWIVKDPNETTYSIDHIYKEIFKKDTTANNYDKLSRLGFIDLDRGYNPKMYSLSYESYYHMEVIGKMLKSCGYREQIADARTKIRQIINNQFVIIKNNYFQNSN